LTYLLVIQVISYATELSAKREQHQSEPSEAEEMDPAFKDEKVDEILRIAFNAKTLHALCCAQHPGIGHVMDGSSA
jgi:hypothetical protein